jgi:hypothetical protein
MHSRAHKGDNVKIGVIERKGGSCSPRKIGVIECESTSSPEIARLSRAISRI